MIISEMVRRQTLVVASIFVILQTVTASQSSCASGTYSVQCATLRKGEFVMIGEHPCKIMEKHSTKTGKKRTKTTITGKDIFTGAEFDHMCYVPGSVDVPIVKFPIYDLKDISKDGTLTLENRSDGLRKDLKLPDGELGRQIQASFKEKKELECAVLTACGTQAVTNCNVRFTIAGKSTRIEGKRRMCSSIKNRKTPTVLLVENNNTV